ncbi:MAG: riboflavin biosynthesis protein RibD, partial [Gemmatimonadetes bacterium]|nr:riboflavin biosynthesis protein RibD [Gemmatimonadota bacterium]
MSTTPPLSDADRAHLGRAVALGRRGWGRVHPNPMVGCVLVRDGEVVAEGWHGEFGGPHAETVALEAAGPAARGATAYVSLEPCRHEGKTPACTRALMASGVARVVFGAADPGAESGGGGAELARAGIEVVGPVFDEPEAHSLNPAFHHRFASALPWV